MWKQKQPYTLFPPIIVALSPKWYIDLFSCFWCINIAWFSGFLIDDDDDDDYDYYLATSQATNLFCALPKLDRGINTGVLYF